MSKKTNKSDLVATATPTEPTPVEISQELQNKLGSLRALTQAHNLLQKGMFPYGFNQALEQSLTFLQELHSQVATEVIADPQADLVPEIVALKEKQNV